MRERIVTQLVGFFGVCALLLAALELYGVLACAVAQRTREIGVRMALDASVASVIRQGLWLVLGGGAMGLAPADPLTLAAVFVQLVLAALLACWLPAGHATTVDPMIALRAG